MTENVCPDCKFDSDDELEYVNHRRDRHFKNSFVLPDQAAYDVWLEGNAA